MKASKRYEELLNICVKAKHAENHTATLIIAGDVFVVTHLHEWTAKKEKDGGVHLIQKGLEGKINATDLS